MAKNENCPCCNAQLNGFIQSKNCDMPLTADDLIPAMCIHCRTFLMFNLETGIREMTQEEVVNLDAEVRADMIRSRETFRDFPSAPGTDSYADKLAKLIGYRRLQHTLACPICQHGLQLAVPEGDTAHEPARGDLSMRGHCFNLLVFEDATTCRPASESEVDRLSPRHLAKLNSLRSLISAGRSQQ